MLSKLRYSCAESVQIVCLSATVPNIADLAQWLDADLYVTHFRPIPLSEFVVSGGRVCNKQGECVRQLVFEEEKDRSLDPDGVGLLCLEAVGAHKSALVFCATKKSTQHCAQLIAASLARSSARSRARVGKESVNGTAGGGRDSCETLEGSVEWDRREVLRQLRGAPCGMDALLSKVIPYGVAFHHAGLTVEERNIIESAFHRGVVSVLTATVGRVKCEG